MSIPNLENIRKWIDALRSGEYEQGEYRLRVGDQFCCLGVACDVSGLGNWEIYDGVMPSEDDPRSEPTYRYEPSGDIAFLPSDVRLWLGLEYPTGDVKVESGMLSVLNDRDRWTFAQIADAIEEQYLLVKAE